jgi:hypothetical protein
VTGLVAGGLGFQTVKAVAKRGNGTEVASRQYARGPLILSDPVRLVLSTRRAEIERQTAARRSGRRAAGARPTEGRGATVAAPERVSPATGAAGQGVGTGEAGGTNQDAVPAPVDTTRVGLPVTLPVKLPATLPVPAEGPITSVQLPTPTLPPPPTVTVPAVAELPTPPGIK